MCVQLVDIFGMFIFIGFLASLLVGIYLLFKVIFPNISNESTNNSFFFFSHVASMKLENFIENFQALNEKQKTEQILEQIHTNSKITHQKMKNIKYSSKLLFLNLLFFFILIFII
jgi:hypothetical protein